MKGTYLFLANGFEDIEALGTRDVLIRGGVEVSMVSITDCLTVESSHGVKIQADITLKELLSLDLAKVEPSNKDFMIFPGGMPGSKNLGECTKLIEAMNEHYQKGGSVAAICAAPKFVLGQLKGLETAQFTCFDGCEGPLVEMGAKFLRKPAVTCGRIITGRGSGHSIDFGFAILKQIKGDDEVARVRSGMILKVE